MPPTTPQHRKSTCISSLITATKWLPVLVTVTIFSWGWYAYTFQLVLYSIDSLVQQILCLVIFHIILVFSFWSYVQTIVTNSSTIPSRFYLTQEVSDELARAQREQDKDEILAYYVKKNDLPVSCRTYSGGIRYCEKCNLVKPDRCHHCSICGTCVLRMDHHCPWINNCVSFSNYKFFVLFLGYTFALCLFVSATTFPYTLGFWNLGEPYNKQTNSNITSSYLPQDQLPSNMTTNGNGRNTGNTVPFSVRFHILFLFFISTMLSFGIVFLYCYHIHLLLRNQSTLEAFRAPLMTYGPDKNAFNLGKKENALQLFGRSKLLWFMPIFTTEGSGVIYDLRPHMGPGDEEVRQELLNHHHNNHYLPPPQAPNSNNDTEL